MYLMQGNLISGGTVVAWTYASPDATGAQYPGGPGLVSTGTITSRLIPDAPPSTVGSALVAASTEAAARAAIHVLGTQGGDNMLAALPMNGHEITNLGAPSVASSAARLLDVNNAIQGFTPKGSARAVLTAGSLGALPNGGMTYDVATFQLTSTVNGALGTQDGVTDLAVNDVILIPGLLTTTAKYNGPYFVVQLGDGSHPTILQRTPNFDSSADIKQGSYLIITDGGHAGSLYNLTTEGPYTLDVTALAWTRRDLNLSISSSTPQDLGTAAAGSTGLVSDAGHVHRKPGAAEVGAIPNTLAVEGDFPIQGPAGLTLVSAGSTRGTVLRRGVSGWGPISAKTAGYVLTGDGADVISTTIATVLAVDAAGNRTALGVTSYTSPLTTNGDLFVRIAGVDSRLGIGTAGYVVGSTGSAPSWSLLSALLAASGDAAAFRAALGRVISPMTATGWTASSGVWTTTWTNGVKVRFAYSAGAGAGGAFISNTAFLLDPFEYTLVVNPQIISGTSNDNTGIRFGRDINNCLVLFTEVGGTVYKGKISGGSYTQLAFASGPSSADLTSGKFWWRISRREGVTSMQWGIGASLGLLPTLWRTSGEYFGQVNGAADDPHELSQGGYCDLFADAWNNSAGHIVDLLAIRTSVPGAPV